MQVGYNKGEGQNPVDNCMEKERNVSSTEVEVGPPNFATCDLSNIHIEHIGHQGTLKVTF